MRDLIKDFPVNVFNIHENLIEVLLEMQVLRWNWKKLEEWK